VLVELEPRAARHPVELVRLALDGLPGPWFPWTGVGVIDLAPVADAAGLAATEIWEDGGRCFARLVRCRPEWLVR
jgi:hypothetical protein